MIVLKLLILFMFLGIPFFYIMYVESLNIQNKKRNKRKDHLDLPISGPEYYHFNGGAQHSNFDSGVESCHFIDGVESCNFDGGFE